MKRTLASEFSPKPLLPNSRALRSSNGWCLASFLFVSFAIIVGLGLLVNRTWYLPTSIPSSGSFPAGPISEYFSVGQTLLPQNSHISRFDLSIAHSGTNGAQVLAEIIDVKSGQSVRSGRVQLLRGRHWYAFQFPALETKSPDQALYLRIRSNPQEPIFDGDGVVVYYDRHNGVPSGRMFARDKLVDTDWDLAIRTYRQAPLREVALKIFNMTAHTPTKFVVAGLASLIAALVLILLAIKMQPDRTPIIIATLVGATMFLLIVTSINRWMNPALIAIEAHLT